MEIILIVLIIIALVIIIAIFLSRKKAVIVPSLFKISRTENNPLISPDVRHWSSQGAFNPTVIKDKRGKVHMLYRALGEDGISRLGYAFSECGTNFDESIPYPVYTLNSEDIKNKIPQWKQKYDPVLKPSGGGWSGSEGPRMVSIEGRIYVTFNAFDGWDYIRVTTISIDEKDFFDKKWRWSPPLLLSPKNEIHKNWVLFPEKINGKFAILHSISPEVQIDFVDKLEDLSNGKKIIKSYFGQKNNRKTWDTWVRGAGPSPIKTSKGWLVLYHGVDKNFPNQYRLGAMLLDLENPKNIIARAPSPILIPETWYENDWKPGVVYACGAIEKDGYLFVYYGGGDKHVCVAKAPLEELLNWLVTHSKLS